MAHSTKIAKVLKLDEDFKKRDDNIALHTKEQARVGGKKPDIFFSDTGSKTSGEYRKGHRISDNERNRKRYKNHLTKEKAMSQAFTKKILSGSTNGLPILVAATATLGTTVHTAVAGTSSMDEIWLYATNNDSTAVNLTLEWGTATAYGNIVLSIPAVSGLTVVIPGLLLQNDQIFCLSILFLCQDQYP